MNLSPASKSLLLPTVYLWRWRAVSLQLHYNVLAENGANYVTVLSPCCTERFADAFASVQCGRCKKKASVMATTVRWTDVTEGVLESWLGVYYPELDPLALTLLQDELGTAVTEELEKGMSER